MPSTPEQRKRIRELRQQRLGLNVINMDDHKLISVNVAQMDRELRHDMTMLICGEVDYWLTMTRSAFLKRMEEDGLPLSLEGKLTRPVEQDDG